MDTLFGYVSSLVCLVIFIHMVTTGWRITQFFLLSKRQYKGNKDLKLDISSYQKSLYTQCFQRLLIFVLSFCLFLYSSIHHKFYFHGDKTPRIFSSRNMSPNNAKHINNITCIGCNLSNFCWIKIKYKKSSEWFKQSWHIIQHHKQDVLSKYHALLTLYKYISTTSNCLRIIKDWFLDLWNNLS